MHCVSLHEAGLLTRLQSATSHWPSAMGRIKTSPTSHDTACLFQQAWGHGHACRGFVLALESLASAVCCCRIDQTVSPLASNMTRA